MDYDLHQVRFLEMYLERVTSWTMIFIRLDSMLCMSGLPVLPFQVNGEDLTQATHHQAVAILAQFFPVCRLTVYRERAEENRPIEKEGQSFSSQHSSIPLEGRTFQILVC